MKRPLLVSGDIPNVKKRARAADEGDGQGTAPLGTTPFENLHENILFEVLRHVDARTLATAACVSKGWCRTAHDEALWELICTRRWADCECASKRLRSVVLALGGFRRLHALCLWPLLMKSPSPPPSPAAATPWKAPPHWGKEEVHLSLSLLSIRYYEMMNRSSGSKTRSVEQTNRI